MKHAALTYTIAILLPFVGEHARASDEPVWPAPPAEARVVYMYSINCGDLSPQGGFFKSLSRFLGGKSESDAIGLPFDIVSVEGMLYVVCQNIPALVEVDPQENKFKLIADKERSLKYPVAVCRAGSGKVLLTDSESRIVYRYSDNKLEPFILSEITRPTGIAADTIRRVVYIADTDEHVVKVFDYDGQLLNLIGEDSNSGLSFHYPTFLRVNADGVLIVNDALNYRIKLVAPDGALLEEFGFEGDVPGAFARPKGIATDSDGHIYVVDNLFDNVQIFSDSGQTLLAIGSTGQASGEFWSPAGIDIVSDTVYIADTFNNRIQALRYLGGEQ